MVLGRAGTRLRLTLASQSLTLASPSTVASQDRLVSPRSTVPARSTLSSLPAPSTLPSPNSLASNENEASSRRYVTLVRQHLPKEAKDTAGERSSAHA